MKLTKIFQSTTAVDEEINSFVTENNISYFELSELPGFPSHILMEYEIDGLSFSEAESPNDRGTGKVDWLVRDNITYA